MLTGIKSLSVSLREACMGVDILEPKRKGTIIKKSSQV